MKKSSRLTLHRETLAVLDRAPLAAAHGGAIGTGLHIQTFPCAPTVFCPPQTLVPTCGATCTVNPSIVC